jgi:uncharacterized RDD family membrane protein YckC
MSVANTQIESSPAALQGSSNRARQKLRREIITPEGVPICFQLGTVGDRGAALLIDLLLMIAIVVIIVLLTAFAGIGESSWIAPFIVIAAFFITNFYFAFFEFRWQGSTPGKRAMRLRVIDADGGQLNASSILARNLIRELEIWMPLRFLLAGKTLWPGAPGWAVALTVIWTLVFLLLPLFNADKLRAGDMIAGTRVVEAPRAVLLTDLVETGAQMGVDSFWQSPATNALTSAFGAASTNVASGAAASPAATGFTFTSAQLSVYGEYELSVLADLLRQEDAARFQRMELVVEKIQTKISYQPRVAPAQYDKFLHDFYAALRGHLEQRMLFGKRKADKFQR